MKTAASLIITGILATTTAVAAPAIKTQTDKVSYSIGYDLGKSFKEQQVPVTSSLLMMGVKDGLQGSKPAMTEAEMKSTMMAFQKQMMQKALEKQKEAAADNLKASNAYIAKVAKQPGVKMITKGLYYKVIKQGHGMIPTKDDQVTVNYEGTLLNGKVFDSSYKRGKPATFGVSQVIPGWTKALQMMPQGSTWMLYISPDLAYGKFAPPTIGANQALTFKVELLKVAPMKKK